MKFKIFTIFSILVLIATGVYAGYSYRDSQQVEALSEFEPTIPYNDPLWAHIDRPLTVTETVEVPIYIDRPLTVTETVYIDKEVVKPLKDFASLPELESFLASDDTDSGTFITLAGGSANFNGQCEDQSLRLIENAAKIGKRLHFTALSTEDSLAWLKRELAPNTLHAMVLAIIGNDCYIIEPSTDGIWQPFNLD